MILLSGAGGGIGRALRERLATAGHEVLALTHGESFAASADAISLDLEDRTHCELLVDRCADCDVLIHLAGRVAIQLGESIDGDSRPRAIAKQFADIYQANVVMTARLLELAHAVGIRHVIFASSQTVYGSPPSPVIAEETPLAPLEYYAASKVACETALALWARARGSMATILRFPGIWGEDRRSGLVYELCKQAVGRGRIRVGADYPMPFDVLHQDDVAAAFEAALNRTGSGWRAYNIATGEHCSVVRLGRDIAALVPDCVVETFGVPQPEIALDAARAAAELGWRAQSRRERLASFVAHLWPTQQHA